MPPPPATAETDLPVAHGQHIRDAPQRPRPPAPVLRSQRRLRRLLEQCQRLVVRAGVAVHLRDALQRPDSVPGLTAPACLGQQLLVEPAHGLVVALYAPGLGEPRQRVAPRHDVAAPFAHLGRQPQQPVRQCERPPLPSQRAPAPQGPRHRALVPGRTSRPVARLPRPVGVLDPAQPPVRLRHGQSAACHLPPVTGLFRGPQLLDAAGEHLRQGGVHRQRPKGPLVLRGGRLRSLRPTHLTGHQVPLLCRRLGDQDADGEKRFRMARDIGLGAGAGSYSGATGTGRDRQRDIRRTVLRTPGRALA
jgi:hypothetical protein